MSEKFSISEKLLLDSNIMPGFYPDSAKIEAYLLDEYTTGNSDFTIASVTTSKGIFTLPITTRQYRGIEVSELYKSEYFKAQYADIYDIYQIHDLRNPSTIWKPKYIHNSRAVLNMVCGGSDSILNSKRDIRYHIKNHGLHEIHDTSSTLVKNTIDRFNLHNLGSIPRLCIEQDLYTFRQDSTRSYYTFANKRGELRAVVELQIEIRNFALVIHFINVYYIKDAKAKFEKTGLNAYYSVVKLADRMAKELGYANVTIDFGVIFKFHYKLKIPGTVLSGTTIALIKEPIS